ncbi:hypothetical protein COY07_02815 [Candidatus Peregrinibacteria bacterium CG_4_10_14_0_2_um_filter_43_11]|nr:MAG: hypothetical protein COY07_02815 [Candidatus Peregrinibacteria bacterium CG_4_10_14_0_2_um_filter_43_11]
MPEQMREARLSKPVLGLVMLLTTLAGGCRDRCLDALRFGQVDYSCDYRLVQRGLVTYDRRGKMTVTSKGRACAAAEDSAWNTDACR